MNRLVVLLMVLGRGYSELIIWGALDSNGYDDVDISAELLAYSACYLGFGFTRCKAAQPDDDALLRDILPYYRNFDDIFGLNYCLQCCSENQDVDVWDLKCNYDADTGPAVNVYGYELRFGRNRFPGDTAVTRCPIKRSACTYDPVTGRTLECDEDNDDKFLVGIEATLHVQKMGKDFFSWRSVTACSVEAIESNVSLVTGDTFTEKYIIHHSVAPHEWGVFDGALLGLIGIAGIYIVLYYCRRQHCIICAKKLVFFKDRCYLCRFYGAHPPDPLLLKALEEKGTLLQGEMPERFPGSRRMVKCCVSMWKSMKCCGRCFSSCCYYMTCGGCYCIRCLFIKNKKVTDKASSNEKDTHSVVSSNPTAINGEKAPKREKVNPFLIKVHPYFLYKVIDHPYPPEAPEWVKRGVPEEDVDNDSESKYGMQLQEME